MSAQIATHLRTLHEGVIAPWQNEPIKQPAKQRSATAIDERKACRTVPNTLQLRLRLRERQPVEETHSATPGCQRQQRRESKFVPDLYRLVAALLEKSQAAQVVPQCQQVLASPMKRRICVVRRTHPYGAPVPASWPDLFLLAARLHDEINLVTSPEELLAKQDLDVGAKSRERLSHEEQHMYDVLPHDVVLRPPAARC